MQVAKRRRAPSVGSAADVEPEDGVWDDTPCCFSTQSTEELVRVKPHTDNQSVQAELPLLVPSNMHFTQPIRDVSSVSVQLWNAHDSKILSSVLITTGEGNANPDGPMSPALGATPSVMCSTCNNLRKECMGHMGSMPLSVPIVHPFLAPVVVALLNTSCKDCGGFLLGDGTGLAADDGGFPDDDPKYAEKKAKLPMEHRAARMLLKKRRERRQKIAMLPTFKERLDEASDKKVVSSIVCPHCDTMQPTYVYNNLCVRLKWDVTRLMKWRAMKGLPLESVDNRISRQRPLTSEQVLTQLQSIQRGTLRFLKFPFQDMTGLVLTNVPFMSMLSRPPVSTGRMHKRAINMALGRFATANTNVRVLRELLEGASSDDPARRAFCKEKLDALSEERNEKMTTEFQTMDLVACMTRLLGGGVPQQFEYKRRIGDTKQQRNTLPSMLGSKYGLVRRQLNGATANTARFVFALQDATLPPTHCTIPWQVMRELASELAVTSWNVDACREFVRHGAFVASYRDKLAAGVVAHHCDADCDQIVMVNVQRGELEDGVPDAFCVGCGQVLCRAHVHAHLCGGHADGRTVMFDPRVCQFSECTWCINGSRPEHRPHKCPKCKYVYCGRHGPTAAHNCVCCVGCCEIRPQDGPPVYLELISLDRREKYAADLKVGDVVMRSLREGDYVTLGRNPTLSMHSKQALRVIGSHDCTFKVPAVFCPGTNADFDGDEGHLYGNQNVASAAEVQVLVANSQNVTDFGCHSAVQHQTLCTFTGLFLMTSSGVGRGKAVMFDEGDVAALVRDMAYNASDDYDAGRLTADVDSGARRLYSRLPPSTTTGDRGKPLWSGQQVFSMLLPNTLNLPPTDLGNGCSLHVIDGTLQPACVLNKKAVASGEKSLVMKLFHRYGSHEAMRFNGCVGVMGDWMAQTLGATLTLDDVMGTESMRERSRRVKERIEEAVARTTAAGKAAGIQDAVVEESVERITMAMLSASVDMLKQERSTTNSMMLTDRALTKGSAVNVAVGQVAKGAVISWNHRSGIYVNKKSKVFVNETLPQFKQGDMRIEARGFISRGLATSAGPFVGYTPHENASSARGGVDGVVATVNGVKDTGATQRELARGTEMHRAMRIGRAVGQTRHTKDGYEAVVSFVVSENGLNVSNTIPVTLRPLVMAFSEFDRVVSGSRFLSEDARRLVRAMRKELMKCRVSRFALPFEPDALFDRFRPAPGDADVPPRDVERAVLEWCWRSLWRSTEWGMSADGRGGALPSDPMRIVHAPEFVLCPTALGLLFAFASRDCRITAPMLEDVLHFCGQRLCDATVESGMLCGLAAAYSPIRRMTQDNLDKFHKPGVTKTKSSLQQLRQLLGVVQNLFGDFTIPMRSEQHAVALRRALNRVRGEDLIDDVLAGSAARRTITLEPCEERAWSDTCAASTLLPSDTIAVLRFNKQVCIREAVTVDELFRAAVFELYGQLDLAEDVELPFVVASTLLKDDVWSVIMAPHVDAGGWVAHATGLNITAKTLASWGSPEWQLILTARTAAKNVLRNILMRGHWGTGSAIVGTTDVASTSSEGMMVMNTVPAVIVQGTRNGAFTELLSNVATAEGADVLRVMPSSVTEACRTLGIEAARAVVIRELKKLVSDGVAVAHLLVLADAMTYTGELTKLIANRDVSDLGDSFITKIIMQQPTRVAVQAAFQRSHDNLMDPSAAAAFGKMPPFGTNDVSVGVYCDPEYVRHWSAAAGATHAADDLDVELEDLAAVNAAVAPSSPKRAVCVDSLDLDDLDLDEVDSESVEAPNPEANVVVAPAALDIDEIVREDGGLLGALGLDNAAPDVAVSNVTMVPPGPMGTLAKSVLPPHADRLPDVSRSEPQVVLHGLHEQDPGCANQMDVLNKLIARTEQNMRTGGTTVDDISSQYCINMNHVVTDMMNVLSTRVAQHGIDTVSNMPMKRVANATRALNHAIQLYPPSPSVRKETELRGEFMANVARIMTMRFAKDPRVKDDAQFLKYFEQLREKIMADTCVPTGADGGVAPPTVALPTITPLSSELVNLISTDDRGKRKHAKNGATARMPRPKRNAEGMWDMPRLKTMTMPVGRPSIAMSNALKRANEQFHEQYEQGLANNEDPLKVDVTKIAMDAYKQHVMPLIRVKKNGSSHKKSKVFNTLHPSDG
jgi:DNA-directed RNA polymerase beta' subunit